MSTNPAYSIEKIGPLYSVYVGSGRSGTLSDENKREILAACTARFASFTCLEAQGYFRGMSEQTLVIQIASSSPDKVIDLAYAIALLRGQLGVGLAGPDENGITVYRRVIPSREPS
jgi:hypothetical protein